MGTVLRWANLPSRGRGSAFGTRFTLHQPTADGRWSVRDRSAVGRWSDRQLSMRPPMRPVGPKQPAKQRATGNGQWASSANEGDGAASDRITRGNPIRRRRHPLHRIGGPPRTRTGGYGRTRLWSPAGRHLRKGRPVRDHAKPTRRRGQRGQRTPARGTKTRRREDAPAGGHRARSPRTPKPCVPPTHPRTPTRPRPHPRPPATAPRPSPIGLIQGHAWITPIAPTAPLRPSHRRDYAETTPRPASERAPGTAPEPAPGSSAGCTSASASSRRARAT